MRNTRNYLVVHSVVDGPYIADPPTPPTPPAPVTHTVTLTPGEGYTAAFVAGSTSPALAGSSVYFTIIPDEGYEITSVTDGTNTLTPVNGVYTISEIDADTTIVVEAAETPPAPTPVTYTVTLETGEGYTAAFAAGSSNPVVEGSAVYFTVVADEGYEITSVTDGIDTLIPYYGVYTINEIAADTIIAVEATPVTPPTPVTYTVTLPYIDCTAAFVAGSGSPALAGSTVNFTVVADDGYVVDRVADGTNILTPVNGVYTINAIAADTTIVANTALIPDPVTYTVTLPKVNQQYAAAFVAGSSSPALAGSFVNFTVVPKDGYEITSVSDGTNTLTPVNGVYTINAIAANTEIRVDGRSIGG